MSKIMSYYRGCMRKVKYHSKKAARDAAIEQQRTKGLKLRLYGCDFCGLWHLTHKDVR